MTVVLETEIRVMRISRRRPSLVPSFALTCTMDPIASDALPTNFLLIACGVALLVVVVFTLLQALIMKFANNACGGEPIGIWYAGFVVWSSSIAGGIGSSMVTLSTGEPGFASLGGGVVTSVVALCLLLKMDPLRAFGVYLVHGLVGGIAAIGICLLLAFGVMAAVPSDVMEEFASRASVLESAEGGSGGLGSLTNLVSFGGDDSDSAPSGLENILGSDQANPFFKSPENNVSFDELERQIDELRQLTEQAPEFDALPQQTGGPQRLPSVQQTEGAANGEAFEPVTSPFDFGIQSNPYAK